MLNMNFIYTLLDCVHVLIAGVTGSGKSTLINALIYALITNYNAEECGLILCDPKRVELAMYKRLPHVLRYGNDTSSIMNALYYASELMERRYKKMELSGEKFSEEKPVFIIIDEMADMMLNGGKEFKNVLQHLLQLGRAANIHVIAATQHPSKKCIPAEIVDNFTARVALRVDGVIQSRQIIGQPGAEKLQGVGCAILKEDGNGLQVASVPCIPETRLKMAVSSCMISADTEHEEATARPSETAQKPREGSSEAEETSSKSLVLSLVQMLVNVIYWLSGLFCKETVSREKKTSCKPAKAFLHVLRMAARLLAIALEAAAHVLLFPWYILECIACPEVCQV